MRETTTTRGWTPRQTIAFARGSCLCMGLGLVLWGLAPLFIERAITGKPPAINLFAANGFVLALGIGFVILQAYVNALRIWAAWTAFTVSILIGAISVAAVLSSGGHTASLLLLIVPAQTAIASWMAIGVLSRLRDARRQSRQDAATNGSPSSAQPAS